MSHSHFRHVMVKVKFYLLPPLTSYEFKKVYSFWLFSSTVNIPNTLRGPFLKTRNNLCALPAPTPRPLPAMPILVTLSTAVLWFLPPRGWFLFPAIISSEVTKSSCPDPAQPLCSCSTQVDTPHITNAIITLWLKTLQILPLYLRWNPDFLLWFLRPSYLWDPFGSSWWLSPFMETFCQLWVLFSSVFLSPLCFSACFFSITIPSPLPKLELLVWVQISATLCMTDSSRPPDLNLKITFSHIFSICPM